MPTRSQARSHISGRTGLFGLLRPLRAENPQASKEVLGRLIVRSGRKSVICDVAWNRFRRCQIRAAGLAAIAFSTG
jgi:hypothetical protein